MKHLHRVLTLMCSILTLTMLFMSQALAVSCPGSHPYECNNQCFLDANQAALGGCTNSAASSDSNNNSLEINTSSTSNSCPASHPYNCGGGCYTDSAQAASAGCSGGSSTGTGGNSGSSDPTQCPVQGRIQSGCRNDDTQDWCDTQCVTYVGNGNDGCINAEGYFISRACVCSDTENAIESIIDIEINLGIDIDDNFIANADYIGSPPSINPGITFDDALVYFKALLGDVEGQRFGDALNTNNDNWLDRNEASAAKGADPQQVLTTSFGCGLSTDDVLAYIGLYLGDGSIDKYQGNLDPSVKDNMLKFTRTWQPGTSALACEYRGGCN